MLRTCKDCDEEKPRECYYRRQWSMPVGCRLCSICHDKRLRERPRRGTKRNYYGSIRGPRRVNPFEFYYECHAYIQKEDDGDGDSDDEHLDDYYSDGDSYALCSSLFDSRKQSLITNFYPDAEGETTNAYITLAQMNALLVRDEKSRIRKELLQEEIDANEYVFEDYEDWHENGYSSNRVLSTKYKGYTLADLKKEVYFELEDGILEKFTVKKCLKRGGVKIKKGMWSGPWHPRYSQQKERESERLRLKKMIYRVIS